MSLPERLPFGTTAARSISTLRVRVIELARAVDVRGPPGEHDDLVAL